VGLLRRILRRKPAGAGDVDAATRRALARSLEQDWDGVESELAAVARARSAPSDVYLALARVYRVRGEIGRAIRVHQNLLLRKDLSAEERLEALRGLAGDFRKGGFLQRAIAGYEELLSQRPRDPEALRALVQLHGDARDHRRAMELARRLARIERRDARPEEARLLVEMAQAAHAEGRTEDARRALKRSLRRDPESTRAWLLLGTIESELGRSKAALAAWRRVPDLASRGGPEIYSRLESSYAALGRPRDFEVYLRERLERLPEDASARLALAGALAARGESEEALVAARQVLEADPDDLLAHRGLARILLAAGREQDALKAFEELLDALERRGLLEKRESIG